MNDACWWSITRTGPMAMPYQLAAEWHDAGTYSVFLGTFEQAFLLAGATIMAKQTDYIKEPPLPDYYEAEDHGDQWHLYCLECGSGWSIVKRMLNENPGNLLRLLDHAHSHDPVEQPVKRNALPSRNDIEPPTFEPAKPAGDDQMARKTNTTNGTGFEALDALENLQVQTYKKGDRAGVRKTGDARNDEIAEHMAKLTKPSELGAFAHEFKVPAERIADLAKKSPNFGQFRMLMGNLVRGVVSRMQKAKDEGLKVSIDDCATRESFLVKMRELKPAPVKAAKPAKAPKAAKPGKSADGGAPASAAGGAKSKSEQAKSGKGAGKDKPAKAAKRRGRAPIKTVSGEEPAAVGAAAGADAGEGDGAGDADAGFSEQ